MKTLNYSLIILLVSVFTFVGCNNDEPAPFSGNITGQVTYDGGQPAGGAYVYLNVDGTNVVSVTDASGNYTFTNIGSGDYSIYSNYNTSNVPAGRVTGFVFLSEMETISVADADLTHNISLTNSYSGEGKSVVAYHEIDAQTGEIVRDNRNRPIPTAASNFKVDYSHGNIDFSFPYHAADGNLTGRFNAYTVQVEINEADLANSYIEAIVDVSSITTGQPGRDEANIGSRGGCIQGTFGYFNDIDGDGNVTDASELNADFQYAKFEATGFEYYGDGYRATGTFTWIQFDETALEVKPYSEEVTVIFKYNPGYVNDDGSQSSNIEAKLVFNTSKGKFYLNSGNVGEQDVEVYATIQLDEILP